MALESPIVGFQLRGERSDDLLFKNFLTDLRRYVIEAFQDPERDLAVAFLHKLEHNGQN